MTVLQARASLRLAALVAGAVIVLSLAGMGLLYREAAHELEAGQAALAVADLRGLAAIHDQRAPAVFRQTILARTLAPPPGGDTFILLSPTGERLAGTLAAWPDLPANATDAAPATLRFELDGARFVGAAKVLGDGQRLLVARPLAPVEATLATLRGMILAVAAAMVAAGLGVGWLAARTVMGRIDRINALADRVAAGALDARLPGPRSRDEFGLLETHVHAMLDRIEALNRATHHLSDSIAHELRTPLSRMMQRLSALHGPPEAVDALRAEMRGTIRIFDSLLDISRAEADAGAGPRLLPVNLSAVTAEVWELYEPVAEDRGLRPEARIVPDLAILGDRTLVARAISNLLDNAVKFTAPGDSVRLRLEPAGDRHVLTVEDTGPGMPEGLRAAAFDRFVRAECHREVAGHGLGLALVRAIAARHGARLGLPARATGFAVEIAWPRLA